MYQKEKYVLKGMHPERIEPGSVKWESGKFRPDQTYEWVINCWRNDNKRNAYKEALKRQRLANKLARELLEDE